jgi:hypothetical protein
MVSGCGERLRGTPAAVHHFSMVKRLLQTEMDDIAKGGRVLAGRPWAERSISCRHRRR